MKKSSNLNLVPCSNISLAFCGLLTVIAQRAVIILVCSKKRIERLRGKNPTLTFGDPSGRA